MTDRAATISWPAASAGARPIVKYEVHRQNGAVSEQIGETAGTSFTLNNLTPGTRYTVNVIARDSGGRRLVALLAADVHDRHARFQLLPVRLTNSRLGQRLRRRHRHHQQRRADQRLDPELQLAQNVAAPGQRLERRLDAERHDVKVVNAACNGSLPTGASTTIGFVGNYSGPNVLPATFTLNGPSARPGSSGGGRPHAHGRPLPWAAGAGDVLASYGAIHPLIAGARSRRSARICRRRIRRRPPLEVTAWVVGRPGRCRWRGCTGSGPDGDQGWAGSAYQRSVSARSNDGQRLPRWSW